MGAARGLQFRVLAHDGITLREHPHSSAKRTGVTLRANEVFHVADIVNTGKDLQGNEVLHHFADLPPDEPCFLELQDGRGFAQDRHLITGVSFVDPFDPNMGPIGRCRHSLRGFFGTLFYEYSIMVIIIINAFTIGAEIDYAHAIAVWGWMAVNAVFTVIYVTEMCLKFFAFGPRTYVGSAWNVFDATVTITTFIGDIIVFQQWYSGGHGGSGGFLAIVPVLRLLRILRVAKMFDELRVLISSFMASMSALGWIAAFTGLWFYICACTCTVFLGRKEMLPDSVPGAPALRAKFANIVMSMYTLFEVMTLEGWTDVVRPILIYRPWLVVFFIFFVFVTAFFLLNLVTAVVVDRTLLAQAEADRANKTCVEDERESRIADLHSSLKLRNSGKDIIRREDLIAWTNEPSSTAMQHVQELEWNGLMLGRMATLLDKENRGAVSLNKMRDMWVRYGQPLETAGVVELQMQLAERLDHQECLCLTLLDALEQISGKKFSLPACAGERGRSFLATGQKKGKDAYEQA